MDAFGVSNRRHGNQSSLEKKKKKKRKKKTREGKRSSASSASASGSPDSSRPRQSRILDSQSCPSIIDNVDQTKDNCYEKEINQCLRWPAHSLYVENSFRTDLIGTFPVAGATEEEENERIAVYKMNRRKRYLAAQQALINKYPDVSIYASSSGSSSGHDMLEDGLRISTSPSTVVSAEPNMLLTPSSKDTSENAPPDSMGRSHENGHKFFSSSEMPMSKNGDSANVMPDTRKEVFSGI